MPMCEWCECDNSKREFHKECYTQINAIVSTIFDCDMRDIDWMPTYEALSIKEKEILKRFSIIVSETILSTE